MDVLDAGVYVGKWEADVPPLQTVLWGPLQAKEMGFPGWECQDGGETGFIYHKRLSLPAGFGAATLIVQNRAKKATLTVYMAGYPANVPVAQRNLDFEKIVGESEAFLLRLGKQAVRFQLMGEVALLDRVNEVIEHQPARAREVPARTDAGEGVWEV